MASVVENSDRTACCVSFVTCVLLSWRYDILTGSAAIFSFPAGSHGTDDVLYVVYRLCASAHGVPH